MQNQTKRRKAKEMKLTQTERSESDDSCPKCKSKGTQTQVDLNTGQVFIVCSNSACGALKSKGWF